MFDCRFAFAIVAPEPVPLRWNRLVQIYDRHPEVLRRVAAEPRRTTGLGCPELRRADLGYNAVTAPACTAAIGGKAMGGNLKLTRALAMLLVLGAATGASRFMMPHD